MKERIAKSLSVVVFATLIFGVSIANVINKDKAFSESENRYLEQKPKFTINALFDGTYTADVEKYVTDQFILRDQFIGVKTSAEYFTGKKDTNGVFFAKDDYLIEKHDSVEPVQLAKNLKFLSEFTNKTASLLGENKVSVMLIPTASNVLTNKLPLFATDFDQNKLIEDAKKEVGNKFIDVRATLDSHNEEYIYYKTDHHWTTLGAYYSYREWCEKTGNTGCTLNDFEFEPVTDDFYGTIYSKARLTSTKPDTIHRLTPKVPLVCTVDYNKGERTTDSMYADEFLEKRDKYSYFLGGNNPVVKITTKNPNGKKLLLIKDSFAHSIAPIFANDFEEVHMLDLRYLNISVQGYIEENGITDAIMLYNTINFAQDNNIFKATR